MSSTHCFLRTENLSICHEVVRITSIIVTLKKKLRELRGSRIPKKNEKLIINFAWPNYYYM